MPGALAHRLQCRTACNAAPPATPPWPTYSVSMLLHRYFSVLFRGNCSTTLLQAATAFATVKSKNIFPIKSKSIFRHIILACLQPGQVHHQVLPKDFQGVHQVVIHVPDQALHIDHFRLVHKSGIYTSVQFLVFEYCGTARPCSVTGWLII